MGHTISAYHRESATDGRDHAYCIACDRMLVQTGRGNGWTHADHDAWIASLKLTAAANDPIVTVQGLTAPLSDHLANAAAIESLLADSYGSDEHELALIEMEARDERDDRPDQPWTPCGCTARAYGGDCAHTIDVEYEMYGGHEAGCEGSCTDTCLIGQERRADADRRAAEAQRSWDRANTAPTL